VPNEELGAENSFSSCFVYKEREREREKITDGNKRMATRRCTACVVCVSTRTTTAAAAVVLYPPDACMCVLAGSSAGRDEDRGRTRPKTRSFSSISSHLINGTEPNPTDRRTGRSIVDASGVVSIVQTRAARARHVRNQPNQPRPPRSATFGSSPPCPRSTQSPTVRVLKLLRYRVNQPNFKRTLSRTLLKSRAQARSPHRPRSNQPAS
jgi:hypothetical protein